MFSNKCMTSTERCIYEDMEHKRRVEEAKLKEEKEKEKIIALLRELDDFKSCIRTICENYIKMMDIKIDTQDAKVDKAVLYLMENIQNVATEVVTKLFYDGKITVDLRYDEETETLYIGGEIIG